MYFSDECLPLSEIMQLPQIAGTEKYCTALVWKSMYIVSRVFEN